ncbi:MAG: tungstate transport system permease protein [Planctomycetaceae bacterium]
MIREGIQAALKLLLRLDASVIDAATRSLWVSIVAVVAASAVGIAIGLVLARKRFTGRSVVVVVFRVGMSVPTVLIGLLCFGLLSRRGALGEFELLYTTWAIVLGEFFLALPIVVTLTHGAITRLDRRVFETAITLGAGVIQRAMTYLREARLAIMLAVLTAFSRCFTELGIAMIVGGNIAGRTRTLTTATALETARGEFASGVAMSLILLTIALLVTLAIALLSRGTAEAES